MSEFEKEAEAVKAVAELGTESLKTIQKAGGFFRDIIGDGLHDWAALKFSDRQKFKRAAAAVYDYDNIIRIAHKVDQKLLRDGVTTRAAIAPKLGIEFLNHASLEYDDSIQDLYAELYANAVNPDKKEQVEVKHIHTLKSLTGDDLRELKILYAETLWVYPRKEVNLLRAVLTMDMIDSLPKSVEQLNSVINEHAGPFGKRFTRSRKSIDSLIVNGLLQRGEVDVDEPLNKYKAGMSRTFAYSQNFTRTKTPDHTRTKNLIRGSVTQGELTLYGLEFCKITKPEIKPLES